MPKPRRCPVCGVALIRYEHRCGKCRRRHHLVEGARRAQEFRDRQKAERAMRDAASEYLGIPTEVDEEKASEPSS